MSSAHRRHHPRWHRRRTPIFWWLEKRAYVSFILRELTSLGVAYTALLLLAQVAAASTSVAAYDRLAELLSTPWAIGWHALLLAVLLFHTLTWLHLAPQALVVRLGARRLPNAAVLGAHYLGWAVATILVVLLLAGG